MRPTPLPNTAQPLVSGPGASAAGDGPRHPAGLVRLQSAGGPSASSMDTIRCLIIIFVSPWQSPAVRSGAKQRTLRRLVGLSWLFLWKWLPHVLDVLPLASTTFPDILARLGQAERVVRAAANHIGVVFVLPVVFPETDGANVEAASFRERLEPTARTRIYHAWRLRL